MSPEVLRLLDLLGATDAVDPMTLKGRVAKRFEKLVRKFLHYIGEAERREMLGQESSLVRADALALGFMLRVMLRPEVQDILKVECARDDEWGPRNERETL